MVEANATSKILWAFHLSHRVSNIQGVPGGNVSVLGGHSISNSKQKSVYVHVSYSKWFLRDFTEQEFGFGAQYCPSLPLYCAPLEFCLWGWMKSKVYRKKVDTRDKLLDLIMDVITSTKECQDALRWATRNVITSCKVHWCWRWNFRKCIVLVKLYQLCHFNNKYRY